MDKLKPCPFCGGKNVETSYKDTFSGDFRRGVYCADCCGGIYPYYDTEAEAIEAWNTRKWKTCRLELEEPNEDGVWWCSYCKSYHQHKSKYPWGYCPRCGAKVVNE